MENTEQEKRVNITLSQKNLELTSLFEKDSVFVFVYKKTEKLATALYMVTNLFSDSEPMKWILRKKASELVSFILGYKDIFPLEQENFTDKAKTKTLELVSLLQISWQGGLISEMNFSLLKQEFLDLIITDFSHITAKEPSIGNLSKTFFNLPNTDPVDLTKMSYITQKTTDDIIKDKDIFKRSNRQKTILGLLKKRKELTVKDISRVIKDCSEKTIQRELISFINAGVLKKVGERRWSKYSLV